MKLLKADKDFLDRTALEVMKIYISARRPQSFGDSMSISRISYKQALAMLEIRNNELSTLIKETLKNE